MTKTTYATLKELFQNEKVREMYIEVRNIVEKIDEHIGKGEYEILPKDTFKNYREMAQNLVRVLAKDTDYYIPRLSNPEQYVESIPEKDKLLLKGIAETLKYMELSEEEKKNHTFDGVYGGFGLPVPIYYGIHKGSRALWFAKEISGNAKLKGKKAGWWTVYSKSAKVIGRDAGWFSIYNHYAEAIGILAGWFSIYNRNSGARGILAGGLSIYNHCSGARGILAGLLSIYNHDAEASGTLAGLLSIYNHDAEASGTLAGLLSIFEGHSKASGILAGGSSIYNHDAEASGTLAGLLSIFEGHSKASGILAGW